MDVPLSIPDDHLSIMISGEHKPYSLSFSTGALFVPHSVLLGELYNDLGDWKSVRSKVLEQNLLQARTNNTAVRVCREIISRLKLLTAYQLSVLNGGSSKDQGHILWAGVCKRYQFIHDFAVEVVHEKFLGMDLLLTHKDYDVFFNQKSEWHEEMERVRESTRNKLRQVLFKMLREADLLSKKNMILPVVLSPVVQSGILDDPDLTLAIFPVQEGRALP